MCEVGPGAGESEAPQVFLTHSQGFRPSPSAVLTNRDGFVPLGDIGQCLEMFSAVTSTDRSEGIL